MDNLQKRLEKSIGDRAQARIERFQRDRQSALDEHRRQIRRQKVVTKEFDFKEPELWSADPLQNPYFVRSRRRKLAYSTAKAIENRKYAPQQPFTFTVPKADGRERDVAAFNIVDEAISHALLKSITRKNLQRLSTHSYAYLPDRGPFDALARVKSEWRGKNRLYIAEFDFKDYFASIDHKALSTAIDSADLLRTPSEEYLVKSFLDQMTTEEARGMVQGTSISVLLANVAALSMDRGFESLGVGYVRYADDTLVWGNSYQAVADAANLIYTMAGSIGASVNNLKSPGIRLLVRELGQPAEVTSTNEVVFLGHSLGIDSTKLSEKSISNIKDSIHRIIYQNLLREPMRGNQNPSRLSVMDNDYVSCIWALRRYIYGNLSEKELRRMGRGSFPEGRTLSGMAAYYPLADNAEQWRSLDHWMNSQIRLALEKRLKLLPTGAAKLEPYLSLKSGVANRLSNLQHPASNGQLVDLRIPSFTNMSDLVRFAVQRHGFGILRNGAGRYLYNIE